MPVDGPAQHRLEFPVDGASDLVAILKRVVEWEVFPAASWEQQVSCPPLQEKDSSVDA